MASKTTSKDSDQGLLRGIPFMEEASNIGGSRSRSLMEVEGEIMIELFSHCSVIMEGA